jgi:hypoxia up-regulated 1
MIKHNLTPEFGQQVPPYYTMEERLGIIEAAKLAKLNVLSLINDGTAVALHYAFGRKFEEDPPQYIVFYDMGHSSTRASLVEFRAIPAKQGFLFLFSRFVFVIFILFLFLFLLF